MSWEDVPRTPRVAVVVLAWNGRDDTLACLESLDRLDWDELSTIVVDNGSPDGVGDAVRERFPHVRVARSDRNLGFAGGNNIGLRMAYDSGADYVLMLNNDTVVDRGMLRELVQTAERRPDAGALCPLIYYLDPPDRIWFAGARFDPRRGHNGRHTGYGERDRGQYAGVRETGRATGAAVLVPRTVLHDVGFLDGDLFLYVEDVEWSLRMREAGYRVLVVPSAKVWHRVSVATGGEHSPTIAYYNMRNTLTVCARHARLGPIGQLRRELVIWLVQLVHLRRSRHPLRNLRSLIAGWRDYRAGRLGERSAAGEPMPEPHPPLVAQSTPDTV